MICHKNTRPATVAAAGRNQDAGVLGWVREADPICLPRDRAYFVGEFEAGPDRDLWVSPASNPGVKAIWVDRLWLVPVK